MATKARRHKVINKISHIQESQQELAITMKKQKAPYSFFFIFILLTLIFSINCQKNKKAQKLEKSAILTGWITENQLLNQSPVYKQEKDSYEPDSTSIEILKKFDQDMNDSVDLLPF